MCTPGCQNASRTGKPPLGATTYSTEVQQRPRRCMHLAEHRQRPDQHHDLRRPPPEYLACKRSRPGSALPCPAGRSVPGRGGPERRGRPRPDGTGPSVRAGSVAHRDHKGTSGRQRAPLATRTRRPPSLQLRQLAQRQPADQIVVPKAGGSSPSPNCRRPAALVNKAGSHRGSASPITHSTQNRMRLGHPHGHPDDPSESVWTRPDRRGTQREQVVSVLLRPVRRGASDS
jgi:hypothetical protein